MLRLLFHMWIKINGPKSQETIWEKKKKCFSSRFECLTLSSRQVNPKAPQTQRIMILGKNIGGKKGSGIFPSTDKIILLLCKNISMLLWITFPKDVKKKICCPMISIATNEQNYSGSEVNHNYCSVTHHSHPYQFILK